MYLYTNMSLKCVYCVNSKSNRIKWIERIGKINLKLNRSGGSSESNWFWKL